MYRLTAVKHCLLTLFCCLPLLALAQLKADFTADRLSGCVPLMVSFTNTTTGASPAATYEWDFSTGNRSHLKNPGAIFSEAGTYAVLLHVMDGGQLSTKSVTVTVYKKPVVDFSASRSKGCAPLPVTFTANAGAGDGTIRAYTWDFGDGHTEQGPGASVAHTFEEEQTATVRLTAVNSYGCAATAEKEGIVEVRPRLTASFSADKTVLCKETDPVQFTNTSTGPGNLSYLWEFGDGQRSTAEAPAHVFNKKGAYSVKLTATSSEGCTAESTQTNYVNAANYSSDFTVPGVICRGQETFFTNTSQPAPTSSVWHVDGPWVSTSPDGLRYWFGATGTYSVKLVNSFGTCRDSVTKQVEVQPTPGSQGFEVEMKSWCGAPTEVAFRDTTTGAVKWEWDLEGGFGNYVTTTAPTLTHTFNNNTIHPVILRVTNGEGCAQRIYKTIDVRLPYVQIYEASANGGYWAYGCNTLKARFTTLASEELTAYRWEFGDGGTSTEAEPEHTYTKVGVHKVQLHYTTRNGCTGTAHYTVEVNAPVTADFELSTTTPCSTEPVTFDNKSTGQIMWSYWYVDETLVGIGSGDDLTYRFTTPGKHSIKLVVTYNGCRDTMEKVDYVTVHPPIPKITGVTNTCEGTRGEVTFTQNSIDATGWTWDFRDGNTLTLTEDKKEIKHTYTRSGAYTAVLTATNGGCSAKDSIEFHVLLKQAPLLTGDKTEICPEEKVQMHVPNLERNTSVPLWLMVPDFALVRIEYGDGTAFTGESEYPGYYWSPILSAFDGGKQNIRMIMKSTNFECYDTTSYLPLKIKGASAGYEVVGGALCYNGPVLFRDTSKKLDADIVTRVWDFGDGQTATGGGTVSHSYAGPGDYLVRLTVTDASGCTSRSSATAQRISVNGPKAAFSTPASTVPLHTAVPFYNSTNTHGVPAPSYAWDFGDGGTATDPSPSHTFDRPGTYTVRLTASNGDGSCRSVATQVITVGNFTTLFGVDTSYLGARSCPPVLARFTNTSTGHTRVEWDFGDGTRAGNLPTPSHVYEKPGRYAVTLKTYGPNGLTGEYTDTVVVGQPSATIVADLAHGCTAQTVGFSAEATNATAYFWDFGDGIVQSTTDPVVQHRYHKAGNFSPRVLVQDAAGCSAAAATTQRVAIDSVRIEMRPVAGAICAPKEVFLGGTVVHQTGRPGTGEMTYFWDFGLGVWGEATDNFTALHTFTEAGTYNVRLKAVSPAGCEQVDSVTVTALEGLGALINGPAELCAGASATFSGSTQLAGQPQWAWLFHDGTKAAGQNAPQKTYPTAGTYEVKLVVDNNGCADTVTHSLVVHALPTVSLPAPQAVVCAGTPLPLTASGGVDYSWSPALGLNTTSGATVLAAPSANTTYTVVVTDAHGCRNSNTIALTVAPPISVQLPAGAAVCSGEAVPLTASGATSYQWIAGGATLSGTTVPNPVARPAATTDYTVVGADLYGCFTDTATMRVTVHPAPTVDAGPDAELVTGTPWTLQAVASPDAVRYTWTPERYLSCSNCPAPEAVPLEPMDYRVTVENAFGCTATDAVSLKLLCSDSRVFIPNSFSPNKDGNNDRFAIKGQGVRAVQYFRIYNRWGETVFEARDFQPGDARGAWDGTYKGLPVPEGAYVYFAEMSCAEETFTRKGTVMVVR